MKIPIIALALSQLLNSPNQPLCDLSQASQLVAPRPLPSPGSSFVLERVAIGRGVQNYFCSSSSSLSIPVAIGAVASLFDTSCIAANNPGILTALPPLTLQFNVSELYTSTFDLPGSHFFLNSTTPVFDLSSPIPTQNLGFVVAEKVASSNAPADAARGLSGKGNGAVAWLYLNATNATVGNVGAVYRINTAGGMPPTTCSGISGVIGVQYAAEYWFYGMPIGSV